MFETGNSIAEVARIRPVEQGGETSHHVTLFSCQRRFNWFCYAHSFATFTTVRQVPGGSIAGSSFTISWLPRSLKVCVWGCAGPGKNLTLQESFRWAMRQQSRISAWGPYRVDAQFFQKAHARFLSLERGELDYICIDYFHRPGHATNCIHALSDLGLTPHLLRTGFSHGDGATRKLIRYYSPFFLAPLPNANVLSMLKLDGYPIQFRALPNVVPVLQREAEPTPK